MTWLTLLLADPSPCLRWLVLRELMGRSDDDPEVQELAVLRECDPLVAPLLAMQGADGGWHRGDREWLGDAPRLTALALMRLGYLGFGPKHPAVARGAEFLLSYQRDDGGWGPPRDIQESEENEGYTMIPMQTSVPLRALAMAGYATDPRAERAYVWLMERQIEDGMWPTGRAGGGVFGRVAGYRKMPHSRWGCRSNSTGAVLCLAHHPERRTGPDARRVVDLLLGRETREVSLVGHEVTRLIGATRTSGLTTFYGRFDLAQVLDLAWRVGANRSDPRIAEIIAWMEGIQGEYGLWDARPPQASRWVTFDILRSLSRLDAETDWVTYEPRTPFQTYPKRPRRY